MSGPGTMMNGGKFTQRPREEGDFYPTPPDATEALIRAEWDVLKFIKGGNSTIWEPACGDGAIAHVLESHGLRVAGTDLYDRGYGEGGIDFLATDLARGEAIITNPPFVMADEFIEKALSFRPCYLAMLLKSTYFHAAKRLRLFEKNPPARAYALSWRLDFLGLGSPAMECCWFVWRGIELPTLYKVLPRPTPLRFMEGVDG